MSPCTLFTVDFQYSEDNDDECVSIWEHHGSGILYGESVGGCGFLGGVL